MAKKRPSGHPKPAAVPSIADPPFTVPEWPGPWQMWKLDRITAYPKNVRTHPPEQISLLASMLIRWGPDQPIVVDESGVILKGHGRLAAACEAGFEEFPVVQRRGLPEDEKKAMRLADNQVALLAGYDSTLIGGELAELKAAGFDMPLLGFPEAQLIGWGISSGTEGQDAEVAPEVPKHPVVLAGDLWTLGEHRLLCGDATNSENVAVLMGGDRAVLMNTDPPYGVNYGDIANSRSRPANVRKGGNGKDYSTHKDKKIRNDDLDGEALQIFLEQSIRAALPHFADRPAFYLWHPMLTQGTFFAAAAAADILIHRQIIWVKPSLIMGRGDYHWRHELCFYGWIRERRCRWYGNRAQDTVWSIDRENDRIHPTQKPTELFRRPIVNNTRIGDVVYEPFGGSGSQIIAAEMTGRRCRALEIDPAYMQVAIERWQNFTGRQATLDGKTFTEVQRERQKRGRHKAAPVSGGEEAQAAQ